MACPNCYDSCSHSSNRRRCIRESYAIVFNFSSRQFFFLYIYLFVLCCLDVPIAELIAARQRFHKGCDWMWRPLAIHNLFSASLWTRTHRLKSSSVCKISSFRSMYSFDSVALSKAACGRRSNAIYGIDWLGSCRIDRSSLRFPRRCPVQSMAPW